MASLYNFLSVVICLLAFAAFRRFDELPKLFRSDVKIENDMWGSSLLPQMLACQTGFLSFMAAGLVKWLRTGMCKILYLHDVFSVSKAFRYLVFSCVPLFNLFCWSCPGDRCILYCASGCKRGFSSSCCPTIPCQLACDLDVWS